MKYIITKSQLDKVIFKYLDNQDFIQIKKGKHIYFVNSEGDKYAQIRYDKPAGWFRYDKSDGRCYIDIKLINEISTFFSLQESDSKQFIGRWVENTLQMRITNTVTADEWFVSELRIPN
jgi:hypothetical protein